MSIEYCNGTWISEFVLCHLSNIQALSQNGYQNWESHIVLLWTIKQSNHKANLAPNGTWLIFSNKPINSMKKEAMALVSDPVNKAESSSTTAHLLSHLPVLPPHWPTPGRREPWVGPLPSLQGWSGTLLSYTALQHWWSRGLGMLSYTGGGAGRMLGLGWITQGNCFTCHFINDWHTRTWRIREYAFTVLEVMKPMSGLSTWKPNFNGDK